MIVRCACGADSWEDPEDGGRCINCGRAPMFTVFRADGWPYCPQCENDELYSLADPPSANAIYGCYACGWMPPLKGLRLVEARRWEDGR